MPPFLYQGLKVRCKMKLRNKIIGKIINFFRTRRWEVLAKMINDNGFTSYAEIGVWKGDTTKYLLKNCKGLEKVYCVDDYKDNNKSFNLREIEKSKQIAKSLLNSPKVVFFYKSSEEASKEIKDETLDIVFIDGDHTYEGCSNDIMCWYPKIKKGGIICGHDYKIGYMGVIKAVNEKFYPINLEHDDIWWVWKGDVDDIACHLNRLKQKRDIRDISFRHI